MLHRFAGKSAIVTGGSAGIGLATVKRLSEEGAEVLIIDRDQAAWEAASSADWAIGKALRFYRADVTSEDEVRQAAAHVATDTEAIDLLVNNAGGTSAETFARTDLAAWRSEMDLNLTSQFIVTAALLAHLRAPGGAIVNVSSINALMVFGNPAYSAAKSAVLALTRSLAIELAPRGIRVNAVVPGTVRTEAWNRRAAERPEVLEKVSAWYPGGTIGEPEDIAAAIAFLVSGDARFVNGTALVVDGGITAGTPRLIADIIGE